MGIILHITHRDAWKKAVGEGYYRPGSLDSDGFIHCSTLAQTEDTANQFFPNQHDLVLLCIDEQKLEPQLKCEAPACIGERRNDLLFPHIYGPLNVSAVVQVAAFPCGANGQYRLPEAINRLRPGK